MQDQEIEDEEEPLIPDNMDSMDLRRPQLGSHQTHANMLMEQAAALGALQNGLRLSGFDEDQAWYLVKMYANFWWGSLYEHEHELGFFDEDDD